MYVYTPGQWALLFFFYCFCGWVWESCYVSAKQRHWVNRGFLHGPLLPIYGSGAIIILFATLPVADNFWLVYFLGMLAATALEYVVGAVMEQLFKVRYWDYTKQPFNLHGYICLTSSIAWGFFSDLLIYIIHPPIDKLLHKLPALLVNPLAAVIAVLFIMDTVKSTKAAIDLREVLTKLTEENAELRRLAKKAEAAQARTAEELQAFREKTSLDRYLLQSYLADELEAHRTAKQVRKQRRRAALENAFRRRVESKLEILANIAQALEKTRAALDDGIDEPGEQELAKHREELDALIAAVRQREAQVRTRSSSWSRVSVSGSRGAGRPGQGVFRPSFSSTMASPAPPQGWGMGAMSATRPDTLAWMGSRWAASMAMGWPTVTRSPTCTRGAAQPPALMVMGRITRAGGRLSWAMGLRRVLFFCTAGNTPPKKEWIMEVPLIKQQN